MFAIFMAFLGPSMHAVCNIMSAHLSGKVFSRVSTMIFYTMLTNCISLPFILVFGTPQAVPTALIPFFAVVVLIEILYAFPYYIALRRVDTSIIAAMFSLGKIVVPVLAYFMVGEELHYSQYLGFGLVIFFSIILNMDSPKKFKINAGFWLMLVVSVLLSTQAVFYKRILTELDWVSTAFYSILAGNILIFGFFFHKTTRNDIINLFPTYKSKWKFFIVKEFFDQMGSVPGKFALSIIPVVVLKAINSTQPLFVLLYGIILYKLFGDKFKEDISRKNVAKKLICFIFIILGVTMAIGRKL